MDIKCRKCGEPWDMDTAHDITEERVRDYYPAYEGRVGQHPQYEAIYKQVMAHFRTSGCVAFGGKCNTEPQRPGDDGLTAGEKAGILYDLLGDDMDGAAALQEDLDCLD